MSSNPSPQSLVVDKLDDFFLPQNRNAFSTPYRPSVFLCCVLILWTGACVVTEMVTYLILIFPITTYCPTIYFSVQSIIRTRRGSHIERQSVEAATKRFTILACMWGLTIMAHIYCWYLDGTVWGESLLLPIYPGSQATLVVFYIAVRHKLHERATRRSCGRIELRHDEELASDGTSEPIAAPDLRACQNIPTTPEESLIISDTYQPTIFLLVVSISLTISTAVIDARPLGITNFYWFIALIQTQIPTTLTQLYIMTRIIRRRPQTPENLSSVAGFTFEITLCWIWTRIVHNGLWRLYNEWAIVGIAETVLMLYFSARYAFSLSKTATKMYKEIESYNRTIPHEAGSPPLSNIQVNTDPLENMEAPRPDIYHPSIIVLFVGIILSGTCIYIEIMAEYNVGVPMTVLVYTPTIVIYTYLIVQSISHTHADLLKYNKAAEWSVQLMVLWILTQAFYVFVWPVSQYFRLAMNPYVRWPAVIVVVYIAARYKRDRYLREGAPEGAVALPPDAPEPTSSGAPTM